MADIRIKELTELTELTDNDYFVVDNSASGGETKKYRATRVTEMIDAVAEEIEEKITPSIDTALAIGSASGDIASFSDGSNLPMPKLQVGIEPQQDLHGYDSPWVGGSGKNKLEVIKSDDTNYGITTVNNNGTVTMSGTCTGTPYSMIFGGSTYTKSKNLKLMRFGTAEFNFRVGVLLYNSDTLIYTAPDVWVYKNNQYTYDFNSYEYDRIVIVIRISNDTIANGTVSLLLYDASETNPTTFAPYSNECPIIGWDECNVTRTGKNLVNWKWNTFNDGKMEIFLKSGTYTLSAESTLSNGNAYIRGTKPSGEYCTKQELGLNDWSDSSTSGVYYGGGGQQTYTFSVPNSGAVIEVGKLNNNGTISAQLEVGSTATTYEPYNGNTYTIDLDGTRYGGELRIINGVAEFVADRKYLTIDDFNSASAGTSAGGLHWFDANYKPEGKLGNKNICSICAYVQNGWASTITVMSVGISATIPVRIYDSSESLSDFKNKYPNLQVCYELATPIEVQLTPTQVKSLLGSNNVWADTGEIIDCEYKRDATAIINSLIARIEALENQ